MKFFETGLLLLCVVAFSLQACKKEETGSVKSYLSGSIEFEFPNYVTPGYEMTYDTKDLMTLTRPDEGEKGEIGYYYQIISTNRYDTLAVGNRILMEDITVVVPYDTLGAMSFAFGGYATDGAYYGLSTTKNFVIVEKGFNDVGGQTSLTRYPDAALENKFEDARDNKSYHYVNIDGTDWMVNNLGYDGSGFAFYDSPAMDEIYGRLYTWEQAKTACPEGWRLPADADWAKLAAKYVESSNLGENFMGLAGKVMGDIYFNTSKMWEYWREVKISNESLLSVIPVGYGLVDEDDCEFVAYGSYAAFWTSDDMGDSAAVRYIYEDKDIVYYGEMPKNEFATTIRCIR